MSVVLCIALLGLVIGGVEAKGKDVTAGMALAIGAAWAIAIMAVVFGLLVLERGWP